MEVVLLTFAIARRQATARGAVHLQVARARVRMRVRQNVRNEREVSAGTALQLSTAGRREERFEDDEDRGNKRTGM